LRGQQLKIEPPHITGCHHRLHFAWLKLQAVPSGRKKAEKSEKKRKKVAA